MTMIVCGTGRDAESAAAGLCPHCGLELEDPCVNPQLNKALPPHLRGRCPEERRRHRRIALRAKVCVDGHAALLFNVSRSGLMLSSPSLPPGREVSIDLEAGGESFSLQGVVRWASRRISFSCLFDFGVEIIGPPGRYLEFVARLEAAF